jgi:putative heme iron utilization protein
MNRDHAEAIADYARHFARADTDGWTMTGIDVDGFDLMNGDEIRRVFFLSPLRNANDLRNVLTGMAKESRKI